MRPIALLLVLPLAACAATRTPTTVTTITARGPSQPPPFVPARVPGVEFDTEASIVRFHVNDLGAEKAWYTRVLGCQVFYELAEHGWCEMTTPARGVLLGLSHNPGAVASDTASLGFGVEDMDTAKAWLVKNKVNLEGDVVTIPGVVHLLSFTDPEGNKLWFYQPLM